MRTIKFRGRDEHGEWWYGDLRHTLMEYGYLHIRIVDSLVDEIRIATKRENWSGIIDDKTVGQFTSLFDINGKEIYEGDLLSSPLSEVNPFGMVAWHPNGYFFIDTKFGKQTPTEDHRTLGEMLNYMIGSQSTEFEVIGNIHDNPELLEGGAQ